jgi:small subunit ribosomal protein S15
MTQTATQKQQLIEHYRVHEHDTGSPEVQVALLTQRITRLSDHLKAFRKDNTSKRGLLRMVGHRAALLKYLRNQSPDRYSKLIKTLGLRK